MKDYPYMPGWRLNKENNKPAVNHSILMLTIHGIAEGEWDGNEWVQYRWSGKVKDPNVLYWINLEDLLQLEKEGDLSLQQEQPSLQDNTDEAAREYAKTTFKKPYSENNEEVTIVEPDKYAGFIAGAEWMAKQGETIFDTIVIDGQGQRWLTDNLLLGDYDCGEEVIVQIRKK